MKNIKLSFLFNCINIVFIMAAIIIMVAGIRFMGDDGLLELKGMSAFNFFTFDSNLLLMIVSIVFVIYEVLIIKKRIEEIPRWLYLAKFIITVATTLTMLTVIFVLAPITKGGYFQLFLNANLFFHLLSPLLGIICLICFEYSNKIKFFDTFDSLIPTFLYAIFYSINVFIHMENGVVEKKYDWYLFAQNGVIGIVISYVGMFSFTYLISIGLFFLNRVVYNKNTRS